MDLQNNRIFTKELIITHSSSSKSKSSIPSTSSSTSTTIKYIPSKRLLRRRCHSECLPMSPPPPSYKCDYEQLKNNVQSSSSMQSSSPPVFQNNKMQNLYSKQVAVTTPPIISLQNQQDKKMYPINNNNNINNIITHSIINNKTTDVIETATDLIPTISNNKAMPSNNLNNHNNNNHINNNSRQFLSDSIKENIINDRCLIEESSSDRIKSDDYTNYNDLEFQNINLKYYHHQQQQQQQQQQYPQQQIQEQLLHRRIRNRLNKYCEYSKDDNSHNNNYCNKFNNYNNDSFNNNNGYYYQNNDNNNNKRRARTRSESEPHEIYQSKNDYYNNNSNNSINYNNGDLVFLKRPRGDKSHFYYGHQKDVLLTEFIYKSSQFSPFTIPPSSLTSLSSPSLSIESTSPLSPPSPSLIATTTTATTTTTTVIAATTTTTTATTTTTTEATADAITSSTTKATAKIVNPHHTKLVTNHIQQSGSNRPCTPRYQIKSYNFNKRLRACRSNIHNTHLIHNKKIQKSLVSNSLNDTMPVATTTKKTTTTSPTICNTTASTSAWINGDGLPSDKNKQNNGCIKNDNNNIANDDVDPDAFSNKDNNDDDQSDTEYSSVEDDDDIGDIDDINYHDSMSDVEEISSSLNKRNYPLTTILTDCVEGRYSESAPLSASLFPNVPPYITFASHIEKGPKMPPNIYKILKWKLTTITPLVIRKVLINTGFRLIRKTNDWVGVWGKHMKSPCFKAIRSYQKINHIPGTFQIGRKDRMWRNLQSQISLHGKKEFGFMPRTYIFPHDKNKLRENWHNYRQRKFKWIIKPPASARGTGIKVVDRWSQIPKQKPLIVQRYIERPLLINGSKFDLRLYVLVTSINPLRVYMHTDGLARFASVKYSEKSKTLNDRYMHLTNYSINKLSANYAKNEDANACLGHKWTVKSLWKYLSDQGYNVNGLWSALRNLVLRTILAGENSINQMTKLNMCSKYNCYELFGIDVILDSELIPWLLEVNISPSLHSASPLDLHVKGPLVTALLNTALFQVPPKLQLSEQNEIMKQFGLTGKLCYDKRMFITNLTKDERIKHNQFVHQSTSNRDDYLDSILENLTSDDLRCLIITEDELARCAPLERIFPTQTTRKYLRFTEHPRYYNTLLDAWEHRYGGDNRKNGISLLISHCQLETHLVIPPQTVKMDCKNNSINELSDADEDETTEDDTSLTELNSKIVNEPKIQNLTQPIEIDNNIDKKSSILTNGIILNGNHHHPQPQQQQQQHSSINSKLTSLNLCNGHAIDIISNDHHINRV